MYIDEGLTLQEILTHKSGTLNLQERYDLSITLTSSMLQLSHTPWLQEPWTKTDIVFLRAKNQSAIYRVPVDIEHPYLTREHKQTNATGLQSNQAPNDSSKVVALGIMLLEICHGISIDELLLPEDLGLSNQPTEISYLLAARRWLMAGRSQGEFSSAFYNAILYCLQCFMKPEADLTNQAFSQTVEEKILAPLEEEMNTLLSGPSTR